MHATTVLIAARRPAEVVVRYEHVIAPICAVGLLLHPGPLTGPALLLGALPVAGRWVTTGRPWRKTPFDTALALFCASAVVGMLVTLDPFGGAIRLAGLAAALFLFAWARENAASPEIVSARALGLLALVTGGAVVLIHVAAPFLRLDRVPPLALVASLLEPLGLYRFLVEDDAALQRFRWYASGVGAVAAIGLSMTVGMGLAASSRGRRLLLAAGGLFFGGLLLASDNRGSMIAAALTIGCLIVWWRPQLRLLAVLLVFGTLDLIALGMAQRGFNLRTVVERLDFWHKGLVLAAETPLTGVGLGVESVRQVYLSAFQPTYPPFSHAHNIFVQAILEQGILGLISLLLLTIALLRLGAGPAAESDPRVRAAHLATLGGVVALLTAGQTEIVALTTVGTAVLFLLLGVLAASHDLALRAPAALPEPGVRSTLPNRASQRVGRWLAAGRERARGVAAARRTNTGGPTGRRRLAASLAGLVVVTIGALLLAGLARPLAAVPFLNAGTSALYRGTLADDLARTERARMLAWADAALGWAIAIDPDGGVAYRNLGLVAAARGDRSRARQLADEARARTARDDRDGLFGVARAYAAAGALDDAIATWTESGAGPQLLRLGRQLVEGPEWETGITALGAAAAVGAPPRPTVDAISRAALEHGESTEAAVARLAPLVASGGEVAYFAQLQVAHLYRRDGHLEQAAQAVAAADKLGNDEQLAIERGLFQVWSGQYAEAEAPLRWAAENPPDLPHPVPDGDDPHYWLAFVLLKLGRPGEAAETARTGLASLTPEQDSLRVPYHLLLGESLLADGKSDEALRVLRAGQRLAPNDGRFAEGIDRAQAARR